MTLFKIFALYEIKGTPLIPIRKYIPEFCSKIDFWCEKFKNLKIHEICIKQSSDVQFVDDFSNILKKNREELINIFEDCYNINFIIEKEYGNIFDNEGKMINYQNLFYNLINNNQIISFYDTNEKITQFIKNLNDNDSDNNELTEAYLLKECIFSLKDFTRSSAILIQKCFEKKENSEETKILKKNICGDYIEYLDKIKDICNNIIENSKNFIEKNIKNKEDKNNYIIEKSDSFVLKDLLFKNDSNKLLALKKSINIDQIKYYIINGIQAYKTDKTNELFNVWEKWSDCFLKQK